MTTTTTTTKPKSLFAIMTELKKEDSDTVKQELDVIFSVSQSCPVEGCSSGGFKRWGDLFDHMLDGGHNKTILAAYKAKYHRSFAEKSGPDFSHGVRALMLSLFRYKASQPVPSTVATPAPQPEIEAPKAEVTVEMSKASEGSTAFRELCGMIRESKEIKIQWRGAVFEYFVKMFHGMPPCFHCRTSEGKQIHHQNPLFYEIVYLNLNRYGTEAKSIMKEYHAGNKEPYENILKAVYDYHMSPGGVMAVPYCPRCNMDAENKREKRRASPRVEETKTET